MASQVQLIPSSNMNNKKKNTVDKATMETMEEHLGEKTASEKGKNAKEAIKEKYRFYSYGDAMLIL